MFLATGGEDSIGDGIVPSLGLGYQLKLSKRNKLEFTLNTDFYNNLDAPKDPGASRLLSVAGLNAAYQFNFKP